MADYSPVYRPDQLAGYDVVISLKPRVTTESLEGVERLTAIGRCGVGYDNIDTAACTERDIAVYIAPDGVRRPVASSILLLVLALSHNLVRKDRLMRQGKWVESLRPLGREPRGRVIGTIGLGNIAREAMRLLRVLEPARMLAFDPYAAAPPPDIEMVALDTLLRSSDYVLVNCPLNASTRNLVGEAELRMMKPDAVLVNTARGPIVNEPALIRALREGWIRGAALDVFTNEPLEAGSPLRDMDNVVLSSHSVCWTEECYRDIGIIDCTGALEVYHGRPPANVVNPAVLDRPGFRAKLARHRESHG
jgi:D-3-phosphoglycerate dehydrogenase